MHTTKKPKAKIFTMPGHWMAVLCGLLLCGAAPGQQPGTNLDESKVPPYTLPDPLRMQNGRKVSTIAQWQNIQRPYIYKQFEQHVHGKYPAKKIKPRFALLEESPDALGGKATRRQVRVFLHPQDSTVYMDLLVYLPNGSRQPVPVFAGLNFNGNQTVQSAPAILVPRGGVLPVRGRILPADSTRGMDKGWPVAEIIGNGFALVTAYYGDLEPDHPNGWKTGIRTTLQAALGLQPHDWSAIGAWAWGLSRMMDYLETDNRFAAGKVAVLGHSRLGKAALWAAASDPRFSLIILNESGEGGAALSKRDYGETVKHLNDRFPHWFGTAYKQYSGNTAALPVDHHMLLALLAPRPLYVASAEGDQWADPRGEYLGAYHAGPVYSLFGKKGLSSDTPPPLHQPVGGTIRYHIRAGRHDITLYDWQQYLQFAREQWKLPPLPTPGNRPTF